MFDGGAALLIKNPAAAVIRNTVFEGNNGQFGAAVFSNNTSFEHCTFLNNTSSNGAACSNGGNKFVDCDFISNQASLGLGSLTYHGDGVGGGIYFNAGTDTVRNCLFSGNFSSVYDGEYGSFQVSNRGGALYCLAGASPYLVNCMFTNNNLNQFDAFGSGSVIYNEGGNPTFEFCTMENNPASGGVLDLGMWGTFNELGGVICSFGGSVALKSCILSNSAASTGIRFVNSVNADIHHSSFFGISGGNFAGNIPLGLGTISTTNANGDPSDEYYNIYLDPEYVDVVNGDLHLSNSSPCVGGADPFSTVATDYEHNARPLPNGSVRDVGAFESAVGGALMAIDDLTIASDEDQNDVVLRWNVVGAAQSYQVYSSEAQEYVPGLFTLIGTTADTFFVDDGVLLQPAMQRTYVVRLRCCRKNLLPLVACT
ncbi:MAG: hypothetical protein IPP40_16615 [bacterium]|nr:hypothetical protein [bacterium]